jgi:hypothetical protein
MKQPIKNNLIGKLYQFRDAALDLYMFNFLASHNLLVSDICTVVAVNDNSDDIEMTSDPRYGTFWIAKIDFIHYMEEYTLPF